MSLDGLSISLGQLDITNEPSSPSSTWPSHQQASVTHPTSRQPFKPPGQIFHSFLCLDVESTCISTDQRGPNPHNLTEQQLAWLYPNEIIEWPVVLMQWRMHEGRWELYEVARYRSFVKPVWRPEVSDFCTQLTGITQVSQHACIPIHEFGVWSL